MTELIRQRGRRRRKQRGALLVQILFLGAGASALAGAGVGDVIHYWTAVLVALAIYTTHASLRPRNVPGLVFAVSTAAIWLWLLFWWEWAARTRVGHEDAIIVVAYAFAAAGPILGVDSSSYPSSCLPTNPTMAACTGTSCFGPRWSRRPM